MSRCKIAGLPRPRLKNPCSMIWISMEWLQAKGGKLIVEFRLLTRQSKRGEKPGLKNYEEITRQNRCQAPAKEQETSQLVRCQGLASNGITRTSILGKIC